MGRSQGGRRKVERGREQGRDGEGEVGEGEEKIELIIASANSSLICNFRSSKERRHDFGEISCVVLLACSGKCLRIIGALFGEFSAALRLGSG